MPSSRSVPPDTTGSLAGPELAMDGAPVVRGAAWRYRARLLVPVETARRTVRVRSGALVLLEDAEGRQGWGEASPLDGFGRSRRRSLAAALGMALTSVLGQRPSAAWDAVARLRPGDATEAAVAFALETAALDLLGQASGRPLRDLLSAGADERVPSNALLRGRTPEEVAESARRARSEGFRTAKLKVGDRPLREDLARVRAARDALGPEAGLRLDANGAWSELEAVAALRALKGLRVEFVEQPVPPGNPEVLARVRRASPVPVAADEDAADLARVERLLACEAADVLVLKPTVVGGLRACLDVARCALGAGAGVVVTSALDGPIAVAAAGQLAAALPERRYAHGLSTVRLFARDLGEPRLSIEAGELLLPGGPGLGIRAAPAVVAGAPWIEVRR